MNPTISRLGPRGKISLLQAIRNPLCTKCELHTHSHNVCIMGRGNTMSKLMLVGEAPGAAEAEHGRPFCGPSGQWMQRMIDRLGLTNHCYITNAVRCRPPNNRAPTAVERRACRQYLIEEFYVVRPKILVLLGRTACESAGLGPLPRFEILQPEQSPAWLSSTMTPVIHLWHPSYVLRMGGPSEETRTSKQFEHGLRLAAEYAGFTGVMPQV